MAQPNKNLSQNENIEYANFSSTSEKRRDQKKVEKNTNAIKQQLLPKVIQVLDTVITDQNIRLSNYEKENILSQVMEQMKRDS